MKRYIKHIKYLVNTYGFFYTFLKIPYDNFILIPITKSFKIVQWIPVLWKDEDWNNLDMLRVLKYKLSRVEKVLRKAPFYATEECKQRAGEVKEVLDCLNRILENDYCRKEWEINDKKFGKLEMKIDKNDATFDKNGKPLTYAVKFTPNSKAANKSRMKIFTLEDKRLKADYEKFTSILRDKSRNWWV